MFRGAIPLQPKEKQRRQVESQGPQKITQGQAMQAHNPKQQHYLELLLLEYNLRKCILFKDSMLRTWGTSQRLPSCQMQAKKGETFALGDSKIQTQ